MSAWGPGTRWIAHTPWHGDFGDAAFSDPLPGFPFATAGASEAQEGAAALASAVATLRGLEAEGVALDVAREEIG